MNARRTEAPLEDGDADRSAAGPTLVDVVRLWAKRRPTHRAYVFATERAEHSLTYEALDRRARAIARWLSTRAAPGTRALLLYPLGLDFVAAFFGCLYAGVIAVPLHPGRGKAAAARLRAVMRDCGARFTLTTDAVAAESLGASSPYRELQVLATDRPFAGPEPAVTDLDTPFAPTRDTVAFLQYTSGSTSEPKGTVIRHRNIMANLAMLESAFAASASSVIVSWLPIFHDMGLIGNVLHAAHLGATAVLVSTLGFIKSPIVWLRTIQRYRADFSGAPNFAYDLCVDRTTPEERAGLELGSWRVAFNGAEPVRARTLERFTAAFAPFGFRKSAFAPTYGLAEATLMVSGGAGYPPSYLRVDRHSLRDHVIAPPRDADSAQVLVGNGRYDLADQVVVIVDPVTGQPCAPSQIGEIWVSGGHVAAGYWQNETATERAFGARVAGDARRYLRTGDLGFLRESTLFVTGRLKDLIIVRGQNVYPQDLELTLELALPEVRPGATAAFASDDAETGVVVLAELERGGLPIDQRLARAARSVMETHDVSLRRLVLVRRNTVPKTTSGKIQRQRCRAEYERGDYTILAEWRNEADGSPAALVQQIRAYAGDWIAREKRLPRETVEDTAPLLSYGIDSIGKVALVSALERRFDVLVTESAFFASDTIDDIARHATARDTEALPETPREPGEAHAAGRTAKAVLPAFSSMSWESNDD